MHKIFKIKKISIATILIFLIFYGYYKKSRSLNVLYSPLPLYSQIGTVDAAKRISGAEGKEGFLVYGPYLPMKEGSYAISYKLSLANLNHSEDPQKIVGFCDVNVVDNPQYNVRHYLKLQDFLQKNPQTVVLKFFVPQNMPNVEFRIFQQERQNLSLESLYLSPTIRYLFILGKRFLKPNFLYLIIGLPLLVMMFWIAHKFLRLKSSQAVFIFFTILILQYMWLKVASVQNILNGSYALATQVGVRNQATGQFFGQGGKDGFLVYGPYMPLNEGEYEIKYSLSLDNKEESQNQTLGFCDVNIVDSPNSYTRLELNRDTFEKKNPAEIRLRFTVPPGTHSTEFRVFQFGGNVLTLKGLSLNPATFAASISTNKHRFFQNVLYMCGALLLVSLYTSFMLTSKHSMRKRYLYSTLICIFSGVIFALVWEYRGYNIHQFLDYYDMWRVFYAPVWLPLMFIFFNFLYLLTFFFGFNYNAEKFIRYDSWSFLIFPLFIILELSLGSFHSHLKLGNLYLVPLLIKTVIYFMFLWQNFQRQERPGTKAKAIVLFSSIFTVYLFIVPWVNASFYTDGDETIYMLMGQSLVADHDFDITNNVLEDDCLSYHPSVRWTGWNGMYTRPLLPLLVTPGIMLAGRFGASLTQVLVGCSLLTILFFIISRITSSVKAAFWTTIIAAFSCPIGIYATLIFTEIVAAAIVAYLLYILLSKELLRFNQVMLFIIGVFTLLFLKERYSIIALLSVILFTTYKLERKMYTLIFFLLIGIGISGFILYDKLCWEWVNTQRFMRYFEETGSAFPRIFSGLLGLLFDQETGLLIHAPFYSCSFLGLFSLWPGRKRELIILMGIFLPYFLLISTVTMWSSFGSPAPRYLVPVMPVLIVGAGVFFANLKRTWTKLAAILAVSWSFIVYYLFVLVPQIRVPTPNISSGRNQIFDWLYAKAYFPNISVLFPSFLQVSVRSYVLALLYMTVLIFAAIVYKSQKSNLSGMVSVAVLKKQMVAVLGIVCGMLLTAHLTFNNFLEYKAGECYSGGAYKTVEGWQLLHGVNEFVLTKVALRAGEKVAITVRAKPMYEGVIPIFTVYNVTDGENILVGNASLQNKDWQDYRFVYTAAKGDIHVFRFVHANYSEQMGMYIDTIKFQQVQG